MDDPLSGQAMGEADQEDYRTPGERDALVGLGAVSLIGAAARTGAAEGLVTLPVAPVRGA